MTIEPTGAPVQAKHHSTRRTLLTRDIPLALAGAFAAGGVLRSTSAQHPATPIAASPVASPAASPVATPVAISGEARALWVNRFEYASETDIIEIMDRARSANFNLIYFQVRGAADALYRSALEPCAVGLCGQLGGVPAYDPLEVAIREAHARGMQLHAWLNALSGWGSGNAEVCALLTDQDDGSPRHILLDHPEWAMVDRDGQIMSCPNPEEYVYLSPGYPGVRAQLASVTADIAGRYAIDGVHLDRLRYPGRNWSYDQASLDTFGKDPGADADAWDDFRRELINQTVRETFAAMTAVNPALVLSAALWPIYRDRWAWNSSEGADWFYQDPYAWASGGYLDVAVPMTYDPITPTFCERADWACLVPDHVAGIQEELNRHVYASVAARNGPDEMEREILLGREIGVAGFSIYSYRSVEDAGMWSRLGTGLFAEPAEVPSQPWKEAAIAQPRDGATPAA
jgi:uncharacterized lipoprotein YddW (UPF0748 family)